MSSTSFWKAGICIGVLGTALAFAPPSHRSTGGVVASDHPLASEAGAEILAKGGNAVDATIAAVLAAICMQTDRVFGDFGCHHKLSGFFGNIHSGNVPRN